MIEVAFYKARKGNVVDKIIAFFSATASEKLSGAWLDNYSHVEIVFDDNLMFSSSGRDQKVRFRSFPRDDHWDVYQLPSVSEHTVRHLAEMYVGAEYDYTGVLGFIIPFRIENSKKWFCSELVHQLLQQSGLPLTGKSFNVAPQELYRQLSKESLWTK